MLWKFLKTFIYQVKPHLFFRTIIFENLIEIYIHIFSYKRSTWMTLEDLRTFALVKICFSRISMTLSDSYSWRIIFENLIEIYIHISLYQRITWMTLEDLRTFALEKICFSRIFMTLWPRANVLKSSKIIHVILWYKEIWI